MFYHLSGTTGAFDSINIYLKFRLSDLKNNEAEQCSISYQEN
jgi:hypothetical protein